MSGYYTNRPVPQPANLTTGSTPVYSSGWKNSVRAYGNSETPVTAIRLENTSPATVGTDSSSPAIIMSGKGWDTSAPGSSVDFTYRLSHTPVKAVNVASDFSLDYSVEGGAYVTGWSYRNSTGVFFTQTVRASAVLQAQGDGSGVASTTTITDVTAAKDATGATLGETPTSVNAENAAWLKVYIGTTTAYIPYWTA